MMDTDGRSCSTVQYGFGGSWWLENFMVALRLRREAVMLRYYAQGSFDGVYGLQFSILGLGTLSISVLGGWVGHMVGR